MRLELFWTVSGVAVFPLSAAGTEVLVKIRGTATSKSDSMLSTILNNYKYRTVQIYHIPYCTNTSQLYSLM